MTKHLKTMALICSLCVVAACGDGDELPERSGTMDAGSWDAGPLDAHVPEGGASDAG